MRRELPDDDRDLMDEHDDTLDLYNEELARKAVGSLFDESEDDGGLEDDDYVTGFDKPQPPPRGRARTIDERSNPEYEDDEYYTYRKRDRGKNRERVKEASPSPRPAVKVTVATSAAAKGAVPEGRARPLTSREQDDDYDDEFEDFRQRYKNKDRVPAALRRTEPATSRSKRAAVERRYDDDYDSEPANPMRWLAAAASFLLLVLLAFLVYRITIISGQLKEANAKLENTPSNDTQITEMRLTIEGYEQTITEKDEEIDRLYAQLNQVRPDNASSPTNATEPGTVVTEPEDPPDTQPAEEEPPTQTTYTAVKGDNLSKISTKFYGNANPSNIQKIKDANKMTNDNIQIGQTLIIP